MRNFIALPLNLFAAALISYPAECIKHYNIYYNIKLDPRRYGISFFWWKITVLANYSRNSTSYTERGVTSATKKTGGSQCSWPYNKQLPLHYDWLPRLSGFSRRVLWRNSIDWSADSFVSSNQGARSDAKQYGGIHKTGYRVGGDIKNSHTGVTTEGEFFSAPNSLWKSVMLCRSWAEWKWRL